jgi:crotonobetainyl-CoA:carnitine CoA-transferase CaiB-like acyl-CoA transferase
LLLILFKGDSVPLLPPPDRLALCQERIDPFAEVVAHIGAQHQIFSARWAAGLSDAMDRFFRHLNRQRRIGGDRLGDGACARLDLLTGNDLIGEADVVVENFRPGVMEALNIGYEAMSAQNPRIIYCAISGYGPDGPFANRPGLDNIIQGFAGLMTSTGFEGGEPTRVGIPIADLLTGLLGAFGILAALQARERTGRGQRVETSLLESMIGTMGFQAVRVLNGAGVPPPAGNHHPINAPYGAFRTSDGWVTIGATGDKRWSAFCQILDAPEWLTDPRFATNGDRYARRYELAEMISEKLQTHTTAEWEVILNEAGIPCGPIHQLDEALDHPQTLHREMVVEREHPTLGSVRLLGLPVKLSDTPGGIHRTPPLMGEHTTEILRELGLSDAELEKLQGQGVIKDGTQSGTSAV